VGRDDYDRAVTVRVATPADLPVLERLWREFELEVPPAGHLDHDPHQELGEIAEIAAGGLAFLAEEDGAPLGFALARRAGSRLGRLTDLYVVPDARRGGVAAALVDAVVEALAAQGVEHLDLEVQ
jgi:ribosomal protein S18 acetylase RimI-like enzyme